MTNKLSQHVHSGFVQSMHHFPDNAALMVRGRAWSYAELDADARRWASGLLAGCAGSAPKRIAVFAEKNHTAYAGILAALFTGAAFVPLNPKHPSARILRILELAESDAIITDAATFPQLRALLPSLSTQPQVILLPDGDAASLSDFGVPVLDKKALSDVPPLPAAVFGAPDEIAYLMFTSGSTGEPKGVPVTHANIAHFLAVNQARYQFTPQDRFTQIAELTFDMTIFDLFMAWGCGGCSCVMEPIQLVAPGEFLRKNQVTVWFSVPSLVTLLSKRNKTRPQTFPTLRWSLFCGEPLTWVAARAWQEMAPNATIENLYGPTELAVACSVFRCDAAAFANAPSEEAIVPVGKVYSGLSHLLIDEELRPVVNRDSGELCVAGPQTFPGYWKNAEKTAEQILTLSDPVTGGENRYYRTGDRVRLRDDGNYVFLGRVDLQVKVRGHRIELSEIEAALLQADGVQEAVALPWPIEDGVTLGLVAFVSGGSIETEQVTKQIKERLPEYMMPQRIQTLEVMPVNANGKIDRKALAALLG